MIKKTKAWNSGQISGLDRNQATAEDELEVSTQKHAIRIKVLMYACVYVHCFYLPMLLLVQSVRKISSDSKSRIIFLIDKHEPQNPVYNESVLSLHNTYT